MRPRRQWARRGNGQDAVVVEKGTANAEICLVTAVVGNVLTVTRGYNGSTAVSHGNGVAIASAVIALM